MDLLRSLVRSLVTEGVLEKETTDVSREIVNRLKARLTKTAGFRRAFSFTVAAPESIEASAIQVQVKRGRAPAEPLVTGGFETKGKNRIIIMIEVPHSWDDFDSALRQFSILVPEIKEVLRHEFEHSRQSADDLAAVDDLDVKDLRSLITYMLHPAEVSANVSGMYKMAKMKKIDLEKIFFDRYQMTIDMAIEAGASKAEAMEIANKAHEAWVAYAQKRFPHARV